MDVGGGLDVNVSKKAQSETKLWLIQFLIFRRPPRADGRPLYAYRVSESEYLELQEALRNQPFGWQQPIHRLHWAACYAIYVSESYRRNYDRESGWTWAAFEAPLGLTISIGERSELVREGLTYWQRPIRRFAGGHNDYLGSLFAEGGLPWSLLRSGHVFGRAVRSAVRHFEDDRESGRAPTWRIAEAMPGFPQSFRTEEVCLLLAGIVSQINAIVARCRLQAGDDPIAVLDRDLPTWRDDFPIPLDDANAHQLVSDWLDEAKRAQEDWKLRLLDRPSSCSHRLASSTADVSYLVAVVDIQREIRFAKPPFGLSSTRLELACYEGSRLVQRVGVVYAELEDGAIRIKAPKARIEFRRGDLQVPLSLKVLSSGATIHTMEIPGTCIDAEASPCVFESREDAWWFLSTASCTTQATVIRVRMPHGWEVASGSGEAVDSKDDACWFEARTALTLASGEEKVSIDFSGANFAAYRLSGPMHLANARPSATFLGWPRLVCERAEGEQPQVLHVVNGRQRLSLSGGGDFGSIKYQARTSTGLTLFRSRFGLLPPDFRVRTIAAHAGKPARLTVVTKEALLLTASLGASKSVSWDHVGESSQDLLEAADLGHSQITLSVRSRSNPEPLTLRLPFPFLGAQLSNAAGERVAATNVTLEDLPGMEAVLFAGPGGAKTFHVVLQLVSGKRGTAQQSSSIRVGEEPVAVRLNSFAEDIALLLGVAPDQDAHVRMSFLSQGTEHLAIRVGRYNRVAALEDEGSRVTITAMGSSTPLEGGAVVAMCIPKPAAAPISLNEDCIHGVGLGRFRVPELLQSDGPWILCAPANGSTGFRPMFVRGTHRASSEAAGDTFADAVRQYHPQTRPDRINEQVAEMTCDPDHPGWDYLRGLRDGWSHLPLSVFEAWKAVAGNPRALVQAVLRLEMSAESCQRVESELAVIWEAVPLQAWRDALEVHGRWLANRGLPESLLEQMHHSGVRRFRQLWPGFEHMTDFLQGMPLRTFPLDQTMSVWHKALCLQQAQNDHWPTQCGKELRTWALQQPLPDLLKSLPGHSFMNAVTYLPMFLGSVSAGKSPLGLPGVSEPILKHAVRHVANFDRHWFAPAHAFMTSLFSTEPSA